MKLERFFSLGNSMDLSTRLDGLIIPSLRYWDLAAARGIIREAGGYAEIWSSDGKLQMTVEERKLL